MAEHDTGTRAGERRFTRPADPSLSDEANRMLDRELEEATGARVEEGPPRPESEAAPAGGHTPFIATILEARPLIGLVFIMLVIVGVVVGLTTGAWIVLVGLVGLHAVGTAIVAAGVIELTTETEHLAPEVSARLSAEGVADPDRMFTNLVQDVAGAGRPRSSRPATTSASRALRAIRRHRRPSSARR